MGDLQRAAARLASSAGENEGGVASRVVYYEDTARRKVLALVAALRGLEKLQASPPSSLCTWIGFCRPDDQALICRSWVHAITLA